MTEWIPVDQALPKDREKVLVLISNFQIYVAVFEINSEGQYEWYEMTTSCGCCSEKILPSHWAKIPVFP